MQENNKTFPLRNRLNQAKDFKEVFQTGEKIRCNGFALYLKPNQLEFSRLGIVIAKKSVKKSVSRNQLKRVIRESFRHYKQLLMSYDVVVVGHHQLNTIDKSKFRELLDKQWAKSVSSLKHS